MFHVFLKKSQIFFAFFIFFFSGRFQIIFLKKKTFQLEHCNIFRILCLIFVYSKVIENTHFFSFFLNECLFNASFLTCFDLLRFRSIIYFSFAVAVNYANLIAIRFSFEVSNLHFE